MKYSEIQTEKELFNHDQRIRKLEKMAGREDNPDDDIVVVDVVEKDNPYAVRSGAVYNHVAQQVGNIEILLGTI